MTAQDYRAPESIDRIRQRALVAAVIGLVICVIGIFKAPDRFFPSYLLAFMFILGLSLGSLGLLMLQHLTGGDWGIVIRRPLESATRVLAVVAVLFVPIFFGMRYLYTAWLNAPPAGQEGALSDFQRSYLTLNGFRVRAILYFAIWGILVFLFNRWSREQDANPQDNSVHRRLKMLAGPGIIIYVFVMTFAAIDWVMSLSPHWASTIYGFLFVVGQLISSMSLMIAIVVLLARTGPLSGVLQPRHIHDLGKLLLAFVMLWAYFQFSQLLIIWSGNQPEEITFYYSRLHSQWGVIAIIVVIFHFAAFARFEAQPSPPAWRSHLADSHAFGRSFLVHAAGIHVYRFADHLGSRCGAGPRRFVVLFLYRTIETTPGAAGRRSKTCGGH